MVIGIPDDYQKIIQQLDCFALLKDHEVLIFHDYINGEQEIINRFSKLDALVLTRTRTKLTDRILQQLPRLKVISQTGKNAGHIDEEACKKYNIESTPTSQFSQVWCL